MDGDDNHGDDGIDVAVTDDDHHITTAYYITSASPANYRRGRGCGLGKTNTNNHDEDITDLCFRILRISPTMAKLRFRLVPTKMKEHVFWQALLSILYDTMTRSTTTTAASKQIGNDDQNNMGAETSSASTTQPDPSPSPLRKKSPSKQNGATASPTPDDHERIIFKLRRKVEKQEWTIQALQKEIYVLKEQQQQQQEQQRQPSESMGPSTDQSASAPTSPPGHGQQQNSEPKHQHTGEWVMDQDSIDFLAYPPELKDNLRMEKRKRLQEVKAQMKFILDSDKVEDTNGRWSCCGQTEYYRSKTTLDIGGATMKCCVVKK